MILKLTTSFQKIKRNVYNFSAKLTSFAIKRGEIKNFQRMSKTAKLL
jgi:hypothetical protein